MITKGIKICWDGGIEYIELDIDNLDRIQPIRSTIEWWPKEKEWVTYNTNFDCRKIDDTSFKVYLEYSKNNNQHLNPNQVAFGVSTIHITLGQNSGKATWEDTGDINNIGPANWERVDTPLIGGRKRERVSRIQREQQAFRAALIALDQQCVLSREKTVEVLEAAHIIPASSGGAEVIENGMILRADLHRLFDAGFFTISNDGSVIVLNTLEESYAETLTNKRLPAETLERILPALTLLNGGTNKAI